MATFQPENHRDTDVTACQEEVDDLRAALRTHHSRPPGVVATESLTGGTRLNVEQTRRAP